MGNDNLIYVGENVKRYGIEGGYYIKTAVPGINYKNLKMYTPPKLLIRKTGLGIYASIDYTGSMTSQTVYILKLKDREDNTPLEYYLALGLFARDIRVPRMFFSLIVPLGAIRTKPSLAA